MVWVLRRTSVGDYLRSFRPGKVITTGWAKLAMVFGSMGAADRFKKKYHLTGYYCSELPELKTKKEEPMKTKPTCYMCEKKPKPMTATKGEEVYTNAQDVVMFCSIRCAANYALLWGVPAIEQNEHFCPITKKWSPIPAYSCQCSLVVGQSQ